MGYNFDPVMLVIPFILTARDLSNGIQWHGRYYNELDRLDDKLLAGGGAFIIFGVVSGQRAHVGYETSGTPLYKPDSKVNQDSAAIARFFPTD